MRNFVYVLIALCFVANFSWCKDSADLVDSNATSKDLKDSSDSSEMADSNAVDLIDLTALSDKINVISSTPLPDEISENDLDKFVREGVLSKDEAEAIKQNKREFAEEFSDDDSRTLANIYRRFNAKNAESSGESDSDSNKNSSDSSESTAKNNADNIAKTTDEEVPLLLENVYGHIGFFGKSNVLNKSVGRSYGVFSASVGLQYDFTKDTFAVLLDLGVYGMSPIVGGKLQGKVAQNIVPSNFTLHRGNVKYIAKDEFQNEVFDITAGRFLAKRDWIRNFVQGVSVNANYEWFRLWLDWVDEQAVANREYLSDFNVFKTRYNDKWLIATGLGASMFGVDVLPYYYYFSGNLWAVGGKLGLDIDFANKKWRSITTAHYVYGQNKRDFRANYADSNRSESQIVWLEEVFRWRSNNKIVSFGLGYARIFGARFELANVGNISRFESYNTQGYGIMGAGGSDNGGNSSNMFFADTQSFYGFVGFKIDDFSMMFLGRNSQGKNSFAGDLLSESTKLNQHQYSIGARWRIIEGLYVGGVGAFMMENNVNKSYAKGYIEFRI